MNAFGSMSACGAALPNRGGPGCQQLYDDGRQARTLAFVGYGLGAAFGATAVVLLLTGGGDDDEPRKVACAPTATISGFGCAIRF